MHSSVLQLLLLLLRRQPGTSPSGSLARELARQRRRMARGSTLAARYARAASKRWFST
uniref:Uncharacterized protein n=1 Tax=Arundo donax TaxID=35708 RepID=A0A0A8ZFH7_ARUDO